MKSRYTIMMCSDSLRIPILYTNIDCVNEIFEIQIETKVRKKLSRKLIEEVYKLKLNGEEVESVFAYFNSHYRTIEKYLESWKRAKIYEIYKIYEI